MRHLLVFLILSLSMLISACSGGGGGSAPPPARFSIGGMVIGLDTSINTEINNASFIINENGSFTFPVLFEAGEQYSASITKQPDGLLCSISNEAGTVEANDITNIEISCERNAFSITGIISATPLTTVDSDINDPSAIANVSNNLTTSAQIINNLATVHGFVSATPTGRSGDRFQLVADDADYFQANLQAGQIIDLQTMDISNSGAFKGELTLFLLDDQANIIAQATSGAEFQQVTAPANNLYFILVSATSGATKYRLKLNSINGLRVTQKQSTQFAPNEIIIKFKQNIQSQSLAKQYAHLSLNHSDKSRVALAKTTTNDMSKVLFSKASVPGFLTELALKNNESYEKILTLREINRLNKLADVEYAEPNYWYQAQLTPNDQHYHFQWHYPLINLPQAWDITTGKPASGQVIVAVIDTGVFLNHIDLAGQLVSGYDFISSSFNSNDGDGIDNDPDDPGGNSSWHGTHVAGTIAAKSNNSIGVSGISWDAKIMPIRAIGTQGASSFDIMESLRFAAGLSNNSNTIPPQKADIINMSLGGFGYSQAMQDLITQVSATGIIIIAAAGNDNSSTLFYPASYDGVISVSASDIENNKASYSNFGSKIDVAAPGGIVQEITSGNFIDLNNDGKPDGVLSTLVSGSYTHNDGEANGGGGMNGGNMGHNNDIDNRSSTYAFFQGTSMASPHVAGVAALMKAVYPGLTPEEFKNALIAGALTNEAGDVGRDDIFGYGIIDALKAVQEAQRIENGGTPPAPPARIISTPASLNLGTQSSASITLSNEAATPASITGVSDSATWLLVTENTVDNITKLGTYNITIDRTGLGDANYDAVITFSLSNGDTTTVNVGMVVGNISDVGDIGNAYILLMNARDNALIDIVFPVDVGNGQYLYSFDDVPKGTYNIAGGSDIDNDLLLCQVGENCGGYPTFNNLGNIDIIDVDLTDIDFSLDILSKTQVTNKIQGFDIRQFLSLEKN